MVTMMTTVTIMTPVRLHIVPSHVVGPVLVLGAGLKYQAPNDEHHNCKNY
jgi:hypothetical protein